MATKTNYLDRALGAIAPAWQLKRERARIAATALARHYESAQGGRRTSGWNRSRQDANAVTGPAAGRLRSTARDMVRNQALAESALSTIVDASIGWGIAAKFDNAAAQASFDRWANSTSVSVDGRSDFYALQQLIMRSVVQDGECLVRRHIGRPDDSGNIPLQLQVLEADFLDADKNTFTGVGNGNRVVNGVEIDAMGRRAAYWLFREHPGAQQGTMPVSERVPASEILHVYRQDRPGQLRGVTWFAPVMLAMKDLDDYSDASLMKAKVAACLSVLVTDPDGSGAPMGMATGDNGEVDSLEPGMIVNLPGGKTVSVVNPPQTTDYDAYTKTYLRAIAAGIGIGVEDLTGDYSGMPFSAARMSRLRFHARVDSWRWRMFVPAFLDPVAAWVLQAARIAGQVEGETAVRWTPPPFQAIEPDKEFLAVQRGIRNGLMTLSEAIRERGFDPDTHLAELAADFEKLDQLGLVLDIDARKVTAQGQAQAQPAQEQPAEPTEDEE